MSESLIIPDRLFDGETLHQGIAIKAADGIVAEIKAINTLSDADRVLTLSGTVTPGFVDLQVNGGGGVLFNAAPSIDGITFIAQAHHALGTVAIMPTVITDKPGVLESAAKAVLAAVTLGLCVGLHIEGPHIDPRKRGTHDASFIRPLDEDTLRIVATLRQANVAVLITLAPEAATHAQITALANMGAIVSLGHSDCDLQTAQAAFAAGASSVTHLFNAMSQMEGRAPGLTGAAISSTAYVGMICDGVHVADDMLALAIRARPAPDRCFLVSDAMPTVGGPDQFQLYGQDIRVESGRLVNAEGNLAGAHTTMANSVARIVNHAQQPLATALRMAVSTPANMIGAPHLARLTGRKLTDVMVLDAKLGLLGNLQTVIDNQTE